MSIVQICIYQRSRTIGNTLAAGGDKIGVGRRDGDEAARGGGMVSADWVCSRLLERCLQ